MDKIDTTSPDYKKAFNLWIDFRYWTNRYDHSICSNKDSDGYPVPGNTSEANTINKFDEIRRHEIYKKAIRLSIANEVLEQARHDTFRLSASQIDKRYSDYQHIYDN